VYVINVNLLVQPEQINESAAERQQWPNCCSDLDGGQSGIR